MNEKDLFKISLIIALIGIIILIYVSNKENLDYTNISEINKSKVDQVVRVKGIISSINPNEGMYLLNLKDPTGEIKVIVFSDFLEINKQNLVEISGIVKEYEDFLEIEAKSIKVLE